MKINPQKCVACGNCTYVCPMGAIYIDPDLKRATINRDECVECYACYNGLSKEVLPPSTVRFVRRTLANFRIRFEPEPDVCPTTAFEPDKLEWPRVVRRAFSDPRVPHESTGVSGRGTEEVKTNDVTDRVGIGQVGFTIELGRPGIGARFRDFQEMSRAMAKAGVSFEKNNPITTLMKDVTTGDIRDDILNLVGDPDVYGKEALGDLMEGKRTLMLIHLLASTDPGDHAWLIDYLARPVVERDQDDVNRVLELMISYGSIAFAGEFATGVARSATTSMDAAFAGRDDTSARRFIAGLVPYMIERAA